MKEERKERWCIVLKILTFESLGFQESNVATVTIYLGGERYPIAPPEDRISCADVPDDVFFFFVIFIFLLSFLLLNILVFVPVFIQSESDSHFISFYKSIFLWLPFLILFFRSTMNLLLLEQGISGKEMHVWRKG